MLNITKKVNFLWILVLFYLHESFFKDKIIHFTRLKKIIIAHYFNFLICDLILVFLRKPYTLDY